MIINEEGTYTLRYTATDDCGKTTTVDRELVVTDNSPRRTVLYTDGTFIINERQVDEAHNIELHGEATNVYIPFDPDGATNTDKYIFSLSNDRPWNQEASSVTSVEVGSEISPTDASHWFSYFTNCLEIDLSNVDASNITSMKYMFNGCSSMATIDLGEKFDTSNVTTMESMFKGCSALTSLDLGNKFDTSNVTDTHYMFSDCSSLSSLDLGNKFDTSNVTTMERMFAACEALVSLDLGGEFDTSKVTNMNSMFRGCTVLPIIDLGYEFNTSNVLNTGAMFRDCKALATIYAPTTFVVDQVTSSNTMFGSMSSNLVGGAGTTWGSSKPTDKTYAHIDGGTSNPGYFTAKS